MLKFLRDNANSWIMKILLGILVLSFGVFWGVAEFFRAPSTANVAATIGKLKISKQDLVRSVQQEMNRINSQLKGQNITFAQAVKFGLVSQTLMRMVNEVLVEMFMRDTKMTVSEQAIANLIFADPIFKNSAGGFDKEKFKRVLAANRLSEGAFFESRKRALSQMNLLSALRVGQTVPAALVYPLFQVMTQTRNIDVIKIDPSKIDVNTNASVLRSFYENHVQNFMLPEYRMAQVVVLDPKVYGAKVSVSDRELRAYYNENKETLTSPESRTFSIAMFSSQSAAERARKDKQGKKISFEKHEAMTQDVLSPEIAATVFSLKKGVLSGVKKFQDKYVLIRVDRIQPSKTKSFEEVRKNLLADMRHQKALEEISKTVAKIEEGSNQGMSFVEVVKAYKLKKAVFKIDAMGMTDQRKDSGLSSDIVKDIFSLHEGGENQLTELPDGTSYLVYVEKVTPARTLSFNEAKSRVTAQYKHMERMQKAEKLGARVAQDMAKGKIPTGAAMTPFKVGPVSLSDQKPTKAIPIRVLYASFGKPKGVPSVVRDKGNIYVTKTTHIKKIKIEKNIGLYKAYREDLARAISQSIYIGFLRDLKKIYNLKINEQVLQTLNH